jgi:hypothetical protein
MRKKELIETVATSLLILVLLFILFGVFSRKRAGQVIVNDGALTVAQESGTGSLFAKLESESKDLKLVRDPFSQAPIVSAKASPYGVQLSGIMFDEGKSAAIINGEIVKVGDTIGGKVVVAIKRDRVVLDDGSKELELVLEQ